MSKNQEEADKQLIREQRKKEIIEVLRSKMVTHAKTELESYLAVRNQLSGDISSIDEERDSTLKLVEELVEVRLNSQEMLGLINQQLLHEFGE